METLNVQKLSLNAMLPTRAHADDAGLDLYASEDALVYPKAVTLVSTGIAVEVPRGYVGLIRDRSGMSKKLLKVTAGVVDTGYVGEVKVALLNLSSGPIDIKKGDRIAQLLIIPITLPAVREVVELGSSERGASGFGSSGT